MARLNRGPLRVLIGDIVSGAIAPGAALPRETNLAEQFDISRGTAREVIRGLEERSLVDVKHGRGATVNEPDRWDTLDADVLAALLRGPSATQTLKAFLETRRILEIEAAGIAAERADESDVDRLTQAFDSMRTAAARAEHNPAVELEYHEADIAFHRTMIRATKNPTLVALATRMHAATLEARVPLARPMLRGPVTLAQHERVLRAVASGNATAARTAMRAHLDSVAKILEEYSAEHPNTDDNSTPEGHPEPATVA